jgi:hypothetical protein
MQMRNGMNEYRESLDELDDPLRARLLALDEPVSRDDWDEVVRRSHMRGLAGPAAGVLVAAAVACVAAISALGVGPFGPHSAGAPAAASAPVAGRSALPYATLISDAQPRSGLCYRVTEARSFCKQVVGPLKVSWEQGRVFGAVSEQAISSVRIRFSDGTSVEPRIAWLPAPVSTGFFVYRIPPGKIVTDVTGYEAGQVLGQDPWYAL